MKSILIISFLVVCIIILIILNNQTKETFNVEKNKDKYENNNEIINNDFNKKYVDEQKIIDWGAWSRNTNIFKVGDVKRIGNDDKQKKKKMKQKKIEKEFKSIVYPLNYISNPFDKYSKKNDYNYGIIPPSITYNPNVISFAHSFPIKMMNTIFKKVIENQSKKFTIKDFEDIDKYKLWYRSKVILLMSNILNFLYTEITNIFNNEYKNKIKYFNRTNKGFKFIQLKPYLSKVSKKNNLYKYYIRYILFPKDRIYGYIVNSISIINEQTKAIEIKYLNTNKIVSGDSVFLIDFKNITQNKENIYMKWDWSNYKCNKKITKPSCVADYSCCGITSTYDKLNYINNDQFNEFNKKYNLDPNIPIYGTEESGIPAVNNNKENEQIILSSYAFYKSINKYFDNVILDRSKNKYKCNNQNKTSSINLSQKNRLINKDECINSYYLKYSAIPKLSKLTNNREIGHQNYLCKNNNQCIQIIQKNEKWSKN